MLYANLARVCLLAILAAGATAQLAPPAAEIPLYPGVAPGSENWHYAERTIGPPQRPEAQNIVRPVLLYYPADKAAEVGTAVIVAPGGGFRGLMMSYEGVDVAKRLNAMGVDAFVLKYRTLYALDSSSEANPQAGQDVRELAKADGQQAVKVVRQRADVFHVKQDRIGMIGYSAGGAVLLAAVRGPAESRPNFAMPIYAAGANADPPPSGAPPLFIAVAADDQSVGYQGSVDLFEAWRKANVPVELHVFQTGRHGFGVKGGGADHYLDRVEEWLKVNGWLTKP